MKKEVPIKNYIILILISVITVILVGYFVLIYNKTRDYRNNENAISKFLFQLSTDKSNNTITNIDNYLVENQNIVIYISSSIDKNNKEFEEEFKKLIIETNIKSDIVYLDSSKVKKEVYTYIVNNYFSSQLKQRNLNLNIIPNIIVFDKGKVVDILYNYKTQINIVDVRNFLQRNGIIR